MTTDPRPYTPDPRPSQELCTQNYPENTIRTSPFSDSPQIQDLGGENDEKQPQNDVKPAGKQGQGGGPKTKRGREAAARNNTKHGILSSRPVIRGERKRDWEAHLKDIVEGLQPEGRLERKLAGRIALAMWQLERLDRYVTAVTDDYMDNPHRNTAAEDVAASVQNVISGVGGQLMPERFGDPEETAREPEPAQNPEQRVIPENTELKKIIRYEAHLHRLIDKTLRMLEALQAKRLGYKVYHVRHL